MKKIKLLDNSMIGKIAAGEVVERPSSVIKELIENSIDAEATMIIIEIKDGGTSLIRVSDNGKGIIEEDVKSVFVRHATSKMETLSDLENVLSLGFRGEAMSSIAAVSQLEMTTKTSGEDVGSYIEVHGGEIIKMQGVGVANGTTFVVRNLFYNVPARRKFLKKHSTESGYISDIVYKFVLGYPDISFKYIVNGKKILDSNARGDLRTSIYHVHGKDVSRELLAVGFTQDNISVEGYIGKPKIFRNNRSYGTFFVNGRYIKNQLIQAAIEEAFSRRLPSGKFPFYVLNLTIDPNLVDVNVHPAKLEIKFSDDKKIFEIMLNSVQKALGENVLIPSYGTASEENKDLNREEIKEVKEIKIEPQAELKAEAEPQVEAKSVVKPEIGQEIKNIDIIRKLKEEAYVPEKVQYNISDIPTLTPLEILERSDALRDSDLNKPQSSDMPPPPPIIPKEPVVAKKKFFFNYRIIGVLLRTYWAVEQSNTIYLIDQHAAHERVLYEELIERYKKSEIVSQLLLQQQSLKLSLREKEVFDNNKKIFEKLGFHIEEFGDDSIVIRSVPFIFKEGISPSNFAEILDKLSNLEVPDIRVNDIYDLKLDNIANFACKAAVKANDMLNYIEAKSLIERMLTLENPFTCPHGRPTIVELTKYELEKMFKRVNI